MISPITYAGLPYPTQKKIMGNVNLYSTSQDLLSTRVRDSIVHICFYFEISITDLKSKKRTIPLVQARCILCNYLKEHTHFPLKKIGRIIGGRHHATVIYNLNLYKDLLQFNKEFQKTVNNIKF